MKLIANRNSKLLLVIVFFAILGSAVFAQKKKSNQHELIFKKTQLTTRFISEGAAVGDVNHDGKVDVLAGAYWFEAPKWTPHELAKPDTFQVVGSYSDSFLDFAMDVNLDGWVDLIRIDWPGKAAYWHENPKNGKGYWKTHLIHNSVGNESPLFVDMDGDGRKDILCNDPTDKKVIWLKSPNSKTELTWEKTIISNDENLATHMYTHGIGYGDINGDGRKDVTVKNGWWEGPKDVTQSDWVFHTANLGEDCSQMYVLDLNGDGLNDVISASAHNYGVWWHEQGKDSKGNMTWTTHVIDKTFSQTHGVELVDLDKDGDMDFVTGKRYFAHSGKDPGGLETPLICWYEFHPGTTPTWTKHIIDEDSGVGLHVTVEDINKDGRLDIVTGNKKGVRVFIQEK